jgi:hypothetical protein
VLAGTLIGTVVGGRLPQAMHDRVLAGLGLVTLVLGVFCVGPLGAQRDGVVPSREGTSRRKPGMRTSCMGRTGEVRSM